MPKPPLIFWHPFVGGWERSSRAQPGGRGCPGGGGEGLGRAPAGPAGLGSTLLREGKSGSLPQLKWEADEMFKGLL